MPSPAKAKKLSIKKPQRHVGSDELIATLNDPKPGRLNIDVGATRKKKFKLLATDNDTDMTAVVIAMIDNYINDFS